MKKCWTYEKCCELAQLCDTRTEFIKKNYSAYRVSRKNNWYDKICAHMTLIGNKYKRCIYSCEFIEDKCVYVGLTYSLSIRETYRNKNKKDQVTKHINETGYIPIRKQLTNYIDVKVASKLVLFASL